MSETDLPHYAAKAFSNRHFFGRRKGKHSRPSHQQALDKILSRLKVELSQPAPDDITRLWNRSCQSRPLARPSARPSALQPAVRLEIGFGQGEHLLHRAKNMPDTCFIGVEPFVNSMAKLARSLYLDPLDNILLYDEDAIFLLDWLPDCSIDHIDLLYPDPWPKKRHWKRRFVCQKNLDRFARILKPGGKFCFASDVSTYVNWTLAHIKIHPEFIWMANAPEDWKQPWKDWPSTRYEMKAFREGRRPAYLTFEYREII